MARLLFVVWNDSPLPAQFSVPLDCTLAKITSAPVVLADTSELEDANRAEFMLDASRVRCAYLVDVPDNVMVNMIEPVPVEEFETLLEREATDQALTQTDWPTLKEEPAET